MATAAQAVSNAEILSEVESALVGPVGGAVAGAFQSVKSAASLIFQTGVGTLVRLTIPSPQSGIFLADQQTVDPTMVTAVIASAIGSLADSNGNVVTSYVGGILEPSRNDLPATG